MKSSIIARRLLKVSLISVSVAAGLVVGLATLVVMGFSATAEKALEVSQGFDWEEIPATILESGVLAPVDGGELDYCEEIPSTVFCEESGTSYQPEQPELAPREAFQEAMDEALEIEPEPAPKALVIPKNANKATLRKMVTELGLTAPLDATKAELISILKSA